MKGKDEIMEDTGNGKMIVITGGKVKDANVLVDRIAKLTAAHYLSAVEYELSKRTEQQIKSALMKLYQEKKYWEAAGILMEIFKELDDEGAQDLLVVLNAERTEVNGMSFLEGFLEYTGIFWDRDMSAATNVLAS
jgi:hypothetical protein